MFKNFGKHSTGPSVPQEEPLYYRNAQRLSELIRATHPHLAPIIGMPDGEAVGLIIRYVEEIQSRPGEHDLDECVRRIANAAKLSPT